MHAHKLSRNQSIVALVNITIYQCGTFGSEERESMKRHITCLCAYLIFAYKQASLVEISTVEKTSLITIVAKPIKYHK